MHERPTPPVHLPVTDLRAGLRADCGRCAGLCCVVPAFAASADFALDKPAGTPCPHLQPDARCGIHDRLRPLGFGGCAVFDCFGAGQRVVQGTFAGRDWREDPDVAAGVRAVFPVVRQLQELLWHLAEAVEQLPPGDLRDEAERTRRSTAQLVLEPAEALARLDAAGLRAQVGPLLGRVSERLRADVPSRARDRRGADLMGSDLRRTDLRGTSLRGAYLIGADLRGADLHRTDLLGADLRAADLRGARLATSLFVTQVQVEAARGDDRTTLPPAVQRPQHWATTARP